VSLVDAIWCNSMELHALKAELLALGADTGVISGDGMGHI